MDTQAPMLPFPLFPIRVYGWIETYIHLLKTRAYALFY